MVLPSAGQQIAGADRSRVGKRRSFSCVYTFCGCAVRRWRQLSSSVRRGRNSISRTTLDKGLFRELATSPRKTDFWEVLVHFSRRDQFYQVSHITGPRHTFLALAIDTDSKLVEPVIESLPPLGHDHHAPLNEQHILMAVMNGLREANTRCGTQFTLQQVQYVTNDTGPEALYSFLTLKLIEHLVAGGTFETTRFPFNQ